VARYVGLLVFPPTNISGRPVVCGNQKKLGEQLSALAYPRNHQSQLIPNVQEQQTDTISLRSRGILW
jgi:hypothetical protein